jgi:SAM-dependent methyltransferase
LNDTALTAPERDDPRMREHAQALARKPALRQVFTDIHHSLRALDGKWFGDVQGLRVELGSGVCPMREVYPDTLATDVIPGAHLDAVVDAQNMAFEPESVRCLYMQNAFHHIPDPEQFFRSAIRVLAPGGGMIILDPHSGPVASFVYPRLFNTEGYDKTQKVWKTPMDDAMTGANQALSYVVFQRDRDQFHKKFPDLKIECRGTSSTYIRYVATGGLNFPQLLPTPVFPALKLVETVLTPVSGVFGLHQWYVVRKRER